MNRVTTASTFAGLQLKRGTCRKIAGKYYGTPKEVWNFRTRARAGSPERVARDFIVANAALFGLQAGVSELELQRVIRSLGAAHVIFKQVHAGFRVHRGYVTVHMDRSGRAYLAKNRSVPPRLLPARFQSTLSRDEAIRHARGSLPQRDRESTVR